MRNGNGRPPTLHDVALRANVSKQTISRVVNNKGEVSAETRQRVLAVIQELTQVLLIGKIAAQFGDDHRADADAALRQRSLQPRLCRSRPWRAFDDVKQHA